MFTIKNLAYELPHELAKNLRFRILGNQEILKKSQTWVKRQPVTSLPSPEIKLWQKQPKSTQKQTLKLANPTKFSSIALLCSK